MAITRRSLFGIPPNPTQGSTNTTRLVPLTQGIHTDAPWPLLPPGSTVSMSNMLPLNGVLVPRSRLSSHNTLRTLATIRGLTPHYRADGINLYVWASDQTVHGLMHVSTGSISKASYVSSFGLGVSGLATGSRWQYVQAFSGNLSENMTVAAPWPSQGTLVVLYQTGGASTGLPLYSYLTSAPMASCVGAFNNYILAWGTYEGGSFPTRIRWCQRGSPSNWTGEGSGYEDLLDMRGVASRVVGTADQRVIVFSTHETWYGVSATYPAQFLWAPLDRGVGCIAPGTVAETDFGIVFLGSDNALRLIPSGGGPSQVISTSVNQILQSYSLTVNNLSWGVYDPVRKLYHFFADPTGSATLRGFVLNMVTGEWGFMDYNELAPDVGANFVAPNNTLWPGRVFFGNSNGTVYSFNSLPAQENGSNVTAVWRSGPIAPELAGNYKQLTRICVDYRATSKSTLTLKLSQDGGNNFEATGVMMSLTSAPVSGRVEKDVYSGGAFPAMEIKSESTGYELHRFDVSMTIGGRK